MIAKISKGGSFGGAVDYVLDKGKDAELLAGLGVRMKDWIPSSAASECRRH